ncbi:hypothetical protein EDB84DRAFT_1532628 [Lactarius hengduanensis]|nr:hypothetical protein EDB84DRAFT_1532628 [Lactarius hengduanensis]
MLLVLAIPRPSSSPPLPKAPRPNLPPTNVTETGTAQDALQVDQGVDGRAMPQYVLRSLHREMVPLLTFDRTAEDFKCPACRNYCHCLRKRGEAYAPERDGGWRSWVARQGGSHRAAPTPTSKSKSREPVSVLPPAKQRSTKTTTTTDSQVFNPSWSATAVFTVSGEPLGSLSAFLHGNKTHIVPVS